jgi:hypothetical protein
MIRSKFKTKAMMQTTIVNVYNDPLNMGFGMAWIWLGWRFCRGWWLSASCPGWGWGSGFDRAILLGDGEAGRRIWLGYPGWGRRICLTLAGGLG